MSVGRPNGVGPVGRVDGLELPVLNHSLEDSCVQQLGLLDDALDHLLARLLQLSLHKANHGHVAFDLNVLSQVEAVARNSERGHADLGRLGRFNAGLVTGDAVLVSQVDVHRSIYVRLQAPGHVVEATVEVDLSRAHLADAWYVLDALRDLVPCAVELVRGGIAGRRNRLVVKNERV